MIFLNPLYLFALIFIFGPIIFHMINRLKAKPQNLPTLIFLTNSINKNKGRKNLQSLFLLLIRILIIILITFIFAKPHIKASNEKIPIGSRVLLLIDNSISMKRIKNGKTLISHACKMALDLDSRILGKSKVFVMFLNPVPGQKDKIYKGVEKLKELKEFIYSPLNRTINKCIIKINRDFVKKGKKNVIVIFSDFQKNIFGNKKIKTKAKVVLTKVNVKNKKNIYIDWVKINKILPLVGKKQNIKIKISKNYKEDENINLKIFFNKRAVYGGRFKIKNHHNIINIQLYPRKAGLNLCYVKIIGDSFKEDNQFYFLLNVRKSIRIGLDTSLKNNRFLIAQLKAGYGKNLVLGSMGDGNNDLLYRMIHNGNQIKDIFNNKIIIPYVMFISSRIQLNFLKNGLRSMQLYGILKAEKKVAKINVLKNKLKDLDKEFKLSFNVHGRLYIPSWYSSWNYEPILLRGNNDSLAFLVKQNEINNAIFLFTPDPIETDWVYDSTFPLFFRTLNYKLISQSMKILKRKEILTYFNLKKVYNEKSDSLLGIYTDNKKYIVFNNDPSESDFNIMSDDKIKNNLGPGITFYDTKPGYSPGINYIAYLFLLFFVVLKILEIKNDRGKSY